LFFVQRGENYHPGFQSKSWCVWAEGGHLCNSTELFRGAALASTPTKYALGWVCNSQNQNDQSSILFTKPRPSAIRLRAVVATNEFAWHCPFLGGSKENKNLDWAHFAILAKAEPSLKPHSYPGAKEKLFSSWLRLEPVARCRFRGASLGRAVWAKKRDSGLNGAPVMPVVDAGSKNLSAA